LAHAKPVACGVLLAEDYNIIEDNTNSRGSFLGAFDLCSVLIALEDRHISRFSFLIIKFLLQSYIRHFVNLILTYQPASQPKSLFFPDSAFRGIRKRLIYHCPRGFLELRLVGIPPRAPKRREKLPRVDICPEWIFEPDYIFFNVTLCFPLVAPETESVGSWTDSIAPGLFHAIVMESGPLSQLFCKSELP